MSKPLYQFLTLPIFILTACGQGQMQTPENAMVNFEAFKQKEKFVEDSKLFYPGIADFSMRTIMAEKINKAADDFREVAESENPTAKMYQQKIDLGLRRFSDIFKDLDTEDRERICSYFEELMNIVGLKSSDGRLNEFMYGFDPTEKD